MADISAANKDMITVITEECNEISQDFYDPAKAKVERWFRTMKDQWMASLDMRDFPSLEALNGSLCTYVWDYNLSAHSSLKGSPPQERFFSEPEKIHRLP